MGQWLEKYRAEKRGILTANMLNIGDRVAYQSPQFDDNDQHIGWEECHGIINMIDQDNHMFLILPQEDPKLWTWVHERLITKKTNGDYIFNKPK